jgi:hypothetical protein
MKQNLPDNEWLFEIVGQTPSGEPFLFAAQAYGPQKIPPNRAHISSELHVLICEFLQQRGIQLTKAEVTNISWMEELGIIKH